jgi:hypothetical protein
MMSIVVWFTSGERVSFECEPVNNGHYTLKTCLKNTHEMFVDKWEPEQYRANFPKIRDGLICYSKNNKDHVINLKHVEYYTVEAIQMSEPAQK